MQLDAKTLKVLGSETRQTLLKKLREKPRSLSALAQEMRLSVQSVYEQLEKLTEAGLVQKTRHAKWAYYELSESGRGLLSPSPTPVYLLLGVSVLLFLASAWTVLSAPVVAPQAKAFAREAAPLAAVALPSSTPSPSQVSLPWTEALAFGGILALLCAVLLWLQRRNKL